MCYFKYAIGDNETDKQFHHDFVQTETKDIEVLSIWYTVDNNGILKSIGTNRVFFVNLKNYIATTTPPLYDGNIHSLKLTGEFSRSILNLME